MMCSTPGAPSHSTLPQAWLASSLYAAPRGSGIPRLPHRALQHQPRSAPCPCLHAGGCLRTCMLMLRVLLPSTDPSSARLGVQIRVPQPLPRSPPQPTQPAAHGFDCGGQHAGAGGVAGATPPSRQRDAPV